MNRKFLFPVVVPVLLMACKTDGEKVNNGHIEVYYKEGIEKEAATRTAQVLHDLEVQAGNDTTQNKSMQLLKRNDTVVFRMIVNPERADALNENNYQVLANILSVNVFSNAPVNVDLTDNGFNTIQSLHFRKVSLEE